MSEVRIFLGAPKQRDARASRSPEADGVDAVIDEHERFMRLAIAEAEASGREGEVPVGCVLVLDGEVLAVGHNFREREGDPTAHAELVALRRAAAKVGGWRLLGVTAYVTLEPCPMCAGAFVNARVERVVYGCDDPKAGAVRTLYGIGSDARLNHVYEVVPGVLSEDCAAMLSRFFASLRARRRNGTSSDAPPGDAPPGVD